MRELFNRIKNNDSTLIELDINRYLFGASGIIELADALRSNTTLKKLDISYDIVCDEGASAIANALKFNTASAVKELIIRRNHISYKGASAIADMLKVNTTLKYLDIGFNIVGNKGASAIADALKVNTTLKYLDISYCILIYDEGALAFADMLKVNTRSSVQKLAIKNNKFNNSILIEIENLLNINKERRIKIENEICTFMLCWKTSQRDDVYPLNTIPKDIVYPLVCEYLHLQGVRGKKVEGNVLNFKIEKLP